MMHKIYIHTSALFVLIAYVHPPTLLMHGNELVLNLVGFVFHVFCLVFYLCIYI